MTLFLIVPAALFYLTVLFYILAFVVCAVICKREKKRHRVILNTQKPLGGGTGEKSEIVKSKGLVGKIYSKLYPYFYGLIRYMSIITGKIPSHRIRKAILRSVFCMDIDPNAVIYGGFEIRSPWNISIGRSVIGVGALLDGRKGIVIEDDVCFAQAVSVYTEQHDVNDSWFRTNDKGGTVIVKKHAWISSKTTLLPKCVVEEGCVIASGATLTKSTVPYGIYAGLPARLVSQRKKPMEYTLGGKNYWHFY